MAGKKYLARYLDQALEQYLRIFGAVCIEGAKWTGKTSTSLHFSESHISLGDPKGNFHNRGLAELSPELVLEGAVPRLIDEWQEVPAIWDAVRFAVDQRPDKGQFILTGSSTPVHKGVLHSGAGRIGTLRLRPMSLSESGDSSAELSLADICRGEFKSTLVDAVELKDLIHIIIRGGWPGNLGLAPEDATILPREYLNQVLQHDLYRLEGINRDSRKMELLLRSLARNESTTASIKTLARDVREGENESLSENTINNYLAIFRRLFLIDDQEAFSSNMRSPVRLKQAAKRHLVDPSLAVALLGATEKSLIGDLQTLGFLFEALCERDLRIYAESFGAKLYHYQDYANHEIDAVIELEGGDWAAFEIKLGAHEIDAAAFNLIKIRDKILEAKGQAPRVLAVICGLTNAAYLRSDGVYVLPITALKA